MGRISLLANSGQKIIRKINNLIKDIDRNEYHCTGKPEQLSGNLSGYWSVRIDKANRIVFKIVNILKPILN
ncbi:putative addiction module toxin, Txe/YoeB family [Leptotrichia hofstadii F0254]|uniref:Putative mRNA interferase YoeB n=1 Tax=Leptotrichia hofstadii F0254 TaxID=634994 RepID=C9MUI8_9FUSO|nr:putative addiction module toxin, Txe/YoeB family [Leptotrichia hofstadii F0254]